MGIDTARKGAGRRSHSLMYFAPDSKSGARMDSTLSDALANLAADIKEKAIRSAAYAGAKVFYDEMKTRAQGAEGGPQVQEGVLSKSIYHWHDESKSTATRQVYAIGPNKRAAPHWFNVEYGHIRYNKLIPLAAGVDASKYPVVHGRDGKMYIPTKERLDKPEWVPARPYIRPTWDAVAQAAITRMKERLAERIAELASGAE